jgi:gluconolactonase
MNRCCTSPDTGVTHAVDGPHQVRRCTVSADGSSISRGEVFANCPAGVFDGFRLDVRGNLWLSAGDGVHCHASDGSLLGKIAIPESVANVCFGGPKLNRLFICGTTSVFGLPEHARGTPCQMSAKSSSSSHHAMRIYSGGAC